MHTKFRNISALQNKAESCFHLIKVVYLQIFKHIKHKIRNHYLDTCNDSIRKNSEESSGKLNLPWISGSNP